MKEVDDLRTKLIEQGAGFTVVKNSLTRRAAEAAGADALLALLDGPTAIAFLEADGDPVAVAKALADSARTTKILAVRGGVMQGRTITAEDVEELAKLPPVDVLRGQVLGAVAAPLYTIVGLFTAPLQDLHGLIEARIEQLGGARRRSEAPAEASRAGASGGEPRRSPSAEVRARGRGRVRGAEEPVAEAAAEETEPAGVTEADAAEEEKEE